MKNLQTNSGRMVRKDGSNESKDRDTTVGRGTQCARESITISSKVVIQAFSPIGMPKNDERKRHINQSGKAQRCRSVRGGKNHAW